MCSLTLPPKTERECSYESSLSHNFLQETLCCQFFRGDIGGALQQIDLCFQQFLILLMLKVLWPPWEETAWVHLCCWVLPECHQWPTWRTPPCSCKQLLSLWNKSNTNPSLCKWECVCIISGVDKRSKGSGRLHQGGVSNKIISAWLKWLSKGDGCYHCCNQNEANFKGTHVSLNVT